MELFSFLKVNGTPHSVPASHVVGLGTANAGKNGVVYTSGGFQFESKTTHAELLTKWMELRQRMPR